MAAIGFPLGKGVKRKRHEDDGQTAAACTPQTFHCGTLLDISLLKLHQNCVLAERNLHRSVLIANTLRRLQAEVHWENGRNEMLNKMPLPPPEKPTSQPVSKMGEEITDLNNNLARAPSPSLTEPPFCLLSGNDSSLSSAISTILQDLDFVEDLSPPPDQASPEDDHLLPLKPASPDPRAEPKPPDSIFAAFEIADSDDFLIDGSLDAIFEDIDTSMYDVQQGFPAGACPTIQPIKASRGTPSAKPHNSRTDITELENLMDLLVG
ncbi:SERTA domain-containing protein 1-like [Stegostoma tigrinum]|uniref:SERTA domain-containing protein 1-like n=1 Tax=Stegostoma tigrinum TaxID=3053191 RepID=UPI00202B84EF|nr:SERTA domain-containing protein 1-like [Stegostoma tigrinum]XP_048378571.1 SERTA domain-containing protein 1-like [Stegostoma tigrinum]XP_048378572.1 SERTA domain-containing protein 1-like [Stegostoma tigrinum]XP_059496939.1 SERTA domain-containing protein 1-like [Stegostoma tigrinum]